MVYAGLKDEKRIDDLIAFLKQYDATGKKTAGLESVDPAPRAVAAR
jgi:cytochrome c